MTSDNFFISVSDQSQQKQHKDYEKEYLMLVTTSQFLTTIQKIALYTEALGEYDTSDIVELIEQQRRAPEQFGAAQVEQLEKALAEFRTRIDETDDRVQTSNVRRLFEDVGMPDQASIERVIRYYLTKPVKSQADRDKIDLLITRWGAFKIPGTERMVVLRSERDLAYKIDKIFKELGIQMDTGFKEDEVLGWLDQYRDQLLEVKKMSEIVEKNYKMKLREFKVALGDFFYRPAVLAAIVEVNVTLHNILQEFYLSERARLELYVHHAKRKTGDLEPEKANPIFTLMSRAEEMQRILDETQAAIISQQVVDQAEGAKDKSNSRVDELVALLEQTLQRTNELSQQIQQELTKKGQE